MALTVEDGTGLAGADSYLSLAAFKAQMDAWGYVYGAIADADLEVALRRATDYIDTKFRYKGNKLTAAQALEFPRSDLFDWSSYAITGVPVRVKRACAELAFKATSTSLHEDLARGGMVTSESVGPISVSYSDKAPAGTVFTAAKGFLDPFIRDVLDVPTPFFSTSASADFERDTMDFPGTVEPEL